MEYLAHINEGKFQTVQEHLLAVSKIAEELGSKIGLGETTRLAGLLHDMGKFTTVFNAYIRKQSDQNYQDSERGKIDHSTAGAKYIYSLFKDEDQLSLLTAEIIAISVLSHHGGLVDFYNLDGESTFTRRIFEKELDGYGECKNIFLNTVISELEIQRIFSNAKKEISKFLTKLNEHEITNKSFTMGLIVKFVFSCIVDADRIDTARFMDPNFVLENLDAKNVLDDFSAKMEKRMSEFNSNTGINRIRQEISNNCLKFAQNKSSIYSLTVPTGGGKTLSSMRYALKHAQIYNKERIIYIIPYTSIIEQNAGVFREILENDKAILESHSNVINDDFDNTTKERNCSTEYSKSKLIAERWDSPIIISTMVQFLNIFFSKGTQNIRRMNNLVNAVIVLDEIQLVPNKCISLLNSALNFLKLSGSTIILCTATQPALDSVKKPLMREKESEIIDDVMSYFDQLKRVNIIDKRDWGKMSSDEISNILAQEISNSKSILLITNTKLSARNIYNKTINSVMESQEKEVFIYHLSTSMCPKHRQKVLNNVKEKLIRGQKVICISTQLIEAGVDISFECVYKSLAGLDSIAQAAGRCNRNCEKGENSLANVYIILLEEEKLDKIVDIGIASIQTIRLLDEFSKNPDKFDNDLLSVASMDTYFKYYYGAIENVAKYNIEKYNYNLYDLLNKNKKSVDFYRNKSLKPHLTSLRQGFKESATKFNVIENNTYAVIAPYDDEAERVIAELNSTDQISQKITLLKQAQPYIVNIYEYELRTLSEECGVFNLMTEGVIALGREYYDNNFGLNIKGSEMPLYCK